MWRVVSTKEYNVIPEFTKNTIKEGYISGEILNNLNPEGVLVS